jgi:hypothetical protein
MDQYSGNWLHFYTNLDPSLALKCTCAIILKQASSSTIPSARSQFAIQFHTGKGAVVLFGGVTSAPLGDTWYYSTASSTWVNVPSATSPPARFNMASCVIGPYMYVSAGEGRDAGSVRTFFNDVWRLDVGLRIWMPMNPSSAAGGVIPPARYGPVSGAVTFANGALAFAIATGFDRDVRYNDVWLYDVNANAWVFPIVEGNAPSARCLAAGTSQGNTLYMFGGCGSFGYGPCPSWELWSVSFSTRTTVAAATATWKQLPSCPPRVNYACMSMIGSSLGNAFLLVGGTSEDPFFPLKDAPGTVNVYNITTSTWMRAVVPPSSGSHQPGRNSCNGCCGVVTAEESNLLLSSDGSAFSMYNLSGVGQFELMSLAQLPCSSSVDIRAVHAGIMFVAWSVLLPLGLFAARFLKGHANVRFGFFGEGPWWFMLHKVTQPLGLVVALFGIVVILIYTRSHFGHAARSHTIPGIIALTLGLLQPLNAFFRPHPQPLTFKRVLWERVHKWTGRAACVLAIVAQAFGLVFIQASSAVSVSWGIWIGILTVTAQLRQSRTSYIIFARFSQGEKQTQTNVTGCIRCAGAAPVADGAFSSSPVERRANG